MVIKIRTLKADSTVFFFALACIFPFFTSASRSRRAFPKLTEEPSGPKSIFIYRFYRLLVDVRGASTEPFIYLFFKFILITECNVLLLSQGS